MSFSFKSTGPNTRPDRMKPVPVPATPSPARSRTASVGSTASFTSAVEDHGEPQPIRFSAEEEARMKSTSNDLKTAANKQFAGQDYSSAISTYDKAVTELPIYLDFELAVLQSNIAACHIQMKEWKEAVESAERGLDNLERELPMPKPKKAKKEQHSDPKDGDNEDDGQIVELPDDEDEEATADALRKLNLSDQKKADILRIRTKLLLRRARAKVMLCEQSARPPSNTTSYNEPDDSADAAAQPVKKKPGMFENGSQWGNLSAALADYQLLSTPEYFHNLPTQDQKTVIEMLRSLPPRVEAAKKQEVDEMLGKLKVLGNGILKPFGLSTDMFKMNQDPNTGGWSMGFDQGAAKK